MCDGPDGPHIIVETAHRKFIVFGVDGPLYSQEVAEEMHMERLFETGTPGPKRTS